ncbi:MAG: T9SS type A sorting domain-containing protein [Bacteroidales bacterium]|jgi:hypothetical protein|nr:T9SS type A sorting domain-containing protein [Bacteroidales bacterium]
MKKRIIFFAAFILLASISYSQQEASKPIVIKASYFDISPPLREMIKNIPPKADMTWKDGVVKNFFDVKRFHPADTDDPLATDPNVQSWLGPRAPDSVAQSFDGVTNLAGVVPPDTDGDVGPNHYFQEVNMSYAIYSKTGSLLFGPHANSSIFSGLPNNSNDGDGIVIYDEAADRWLFSQFSLPNYPNGPFFEMVAISQTSDPTGSWYRYQFQFADLPDYPKLGVWPDGYYLSFNRFSAGSGNYVGTGAAALNRTKMLAGDPTANIVYFTLSGSSEAYSMLPSDCDGTFPPVGTPNYFTYINDGPDRLGMYAFHVDWNNTASSTYTQHALLNVNAFNSNLPSGIPQKNTSIKLATLSDRLMFRLQFRTFADHWSMVTCHTINVGANVASMRWYELRKEGTNPWAIYQQGTYSPDNNCRWMGSIAMDSSGNMALGYSVSGTTKFPSIYYTGRLANDPLGEMTIQEGIIKEGGGSQTNTWTTPGRWGDYSSMSVDPSEPSKFWYTQEYFQNTSSVAWKTRIGSFTLNAVTSYSLSGTITYPGSAPTPLAGITVTLKNGSGTIVGTTTTNASGSYSFNSLINGNYTLEPTATKPWGGVTALDVLLYRKHIANISLLTGIFLASGDVNGSGGLTAADVLLVKKRIGNIINSFTVGDWLFNNLPVTISSGNVTQNFNGLCYGDANASYIPASKGFSDGKESKTTSGVLTIESVDPVRPGEVTIPVLATDIQNLGSFQFTLSYNPDKLTFTGIDQWFQGIDNVTVGNPLPGKLTFVWAADANGISIANGKLADLHFTSFTTGSTDNSAITWGDTPTIREFADYTGTIFTPVFINGGVGNALGLENLNNDPVMVYPNPAKDFIMLKTSDMMHGIQICTVTGQEIYNQILNAKETRISTSDFKPGLYMIRINTKTGKFNRSILIEK